jgi:hypothetical protein
MESTYSIEGHPTYKGASNANRVALYVANDCHDVLWMGVDGFAEEIKAMRVGETREFSRIKWQGSSLEGPIAVTRNR